MAIKEVLLPLMGEGIEEATLVKWLKKVGDVVKNDEPLLEVSTDKVDTEIPSPFAGKLQEILVPEGTKAKVHQALAKILADEKQVGSPIANNPTTTPKVISPTIEKSTKPQTNTVASGASSYGNNIKSSPLVRKIAQDYGIALELVPGSGIEGRVTKDDLISFIQNPMGSPTRYDASNPLFKVATQKVGDQEYLDGVAVKREKMSKIRQLISEHMNRSIRTSPHVTTVFEIDMQNAVDFRTKFKDEFQNKFAVNLTYTHMIAYSAICAIKEFPLVNVSVDGEDILFKEDINLGIAVAIETGLIVPVVKKAQNKKFHELAVAIDDLANRARSKKLLPEDVRGGTFSITNPGVYGSLTSNPIINQPQVAILGIGKIGDRPVVINKTVVIRPIMMVSLTFDHRVVDGEVGAKYLAAFKDHLENDWNSLKIG